MAKLRRDTPLHSAATYGRVKAARELIQAGADLNAVGDNDMTPLMCACCNGKKLGSQIALMLIEAGADVNSVRKSDDMDALSFAAADLCLPEVLQALIDHGAAVEGPPGTDQTPLMLAARANHVEALKVLVRNGADISRPCKLPWAGSRTAEGLAEMEKRKKALEYLRGVRLSRAGS